MAEKNPLDGMSDDDLDRIMKALFNNAPKSNVNPSFKQQCRTVADQSATLAWELYQAYMDAGFSNYEAFDLVKIIIGKPTNNNDGKRG